MFKDYVATPDAPAIVGLSLDTVRLYAKTRRDWPRPVKVHNMNFYRRSELEAWARNHAKAKLARRKRRS